MAVTSDDIQRLRDLYLQKKTSAAQKLEQNKKNIQRMYTMLESVNREKILELKSMECYSGVNIDLIFYPNFEKLESDLDYQLTYKNELSKYVSLEYERLSALISSVEGGVGLSGI